MGQAGRHNTGGNRGNGGGAGGGGSFVWKKDEELPIIVAGGGGGHGITNHTYKGEAADGNSGPDGTMGPNAIESNGGVNGSDGLNDPGNAIYRARGWNSTGKNTGGWLPFFEGHTTNYGGESGYGGGGIQHPTANTHAGGGGGGFSGGGVQDFPNPWTAEGGAFATIGGGGGGSYFNTYPPYNGTGREDLGINGNPADTNLTNGKVVITLKNIEETTNPSTEWFEGGYLGNISEDPGQGWFSASAKHS